MNQRKLNGIGTISGTRNCAYLFSYSFNEYINWLPKELKLPSGTQNFTELFYYQSKLSEVEKIEIPSTYAISFYKLFADCSSLTNLSELTISIPSTLTTEIHFGNMFFNCFNLKQTPKIIMQMNQSSLRKYNMSNMFTNCINLVSADFIINTNNLLTENYNIVITYATSMFENCSSLIEIPSGLLNINIANNMFYNCQSIQTISNNCKIFDLSNNWTNWLGWSTRTFKNAFTDCSNLSSVNVNLVSSIADWSGLFKNCINLKDINLSTFIPDYAPNSTVNTSQAFYSCTSLPYNQDYKRAIDTKLFNNANIYKTTADMFYNTAYATNENEN